MLISYFNTLCTLFNYIQHHTVLSQSSLSIVKSSLIPTGGGAPTLREG